MKEVNVLGSVLDNNLLWILKIHPGSPGNPPGSQLVKNTSSTVLEQSFCNTFCSTFHSTCLNSQRLSQFVAPKENQVAKPFLTSKQDKKSHGVPDGYEVDAGNFEFAPGCLQPIQPTTLFLN
jgi:hypothetical protein